MRIYESTFILSPQADDAAFDQQIKAITDLIGANNGKVIQEDRWGIRRLAYPINKFTQGFYTRLVFEGDNKVLSELERFYKLEGPYIRYLTISFEGDPHEKIFGDPVESSDDEPVHNPIDDDDKSDLDDDTDEEKVSEKAEPVQEEMKEDEPVTEATINENPEKTEEQ